jgi:antitoxin ParD1/3/4
MTSSYTLGNHFEGFVKNLVGSGRYASASEVVRDGLRLLEEKEHLNREKLSALRTALKAGRESGPSMSADIFFAELDKRYAGESLSE